jgi:uncharacterized protein YndB with AHSA1/START domain
MAPPSFGGKYLELKPNELIRYTDKLADPNLRAAALSQRAGAGP